ncbi:MAG: DNA-processing protein DprA, partial [Janthinobacterium lividum]
PDPPVLLYLKGRSDLLDQASLAIVGSRNASVQGMANARQFAQALSAAGVTVVSGLALGIDTAAHEGSLAAGAQGGSTVAVIGTGIDLVYPACNHALAHQIASLGCLVSEYPLGAPGVAANFPRRNRLISGLSQGVLVVEAAARSGSLITARLALEQGRDVFAIPGSIHSALSKGCHLLIRQGAKLVESAQHILEELPRLAALEAALSRRVMQQATAAPAQARDQDSVMGATTSQPGEQLQAPQSGLDDEMLLDLLGYDPVDSVQFAQRCGLDPAAAAAWMLAMELAGQVSRGPGGIYQRLVKS